MRKVIKVSLLIIWFGVIFYMSAHSGESSSSMSSGLLKDLCVFFHIPNIDEFVLKYHNIFRKLAHFGEYLVLGFLLYINFTDHCDPRKAALYSLMVCILYASGDEIHQLFVPDRSGSVKDVLIDTAGALCGIFFTHLTNHIVTKRKSSGLRG